MKLLRQFLGPFLALLLTFGSVAEVSAPVTVAAAGVVLGVGHAQAATPAQKAVVLNGVPGWVLRASGALPSIDMDFAHNRAWVGGSGPRAPPSLLTTTRASTGYAQWADGHLSSFAANIPRITDLGLLVEQAATNVSLQSQAFDTASWAVSGGGVVTANTAVAPDGTTTADKLDDEDAAQVSEITGTATTAADTSNYTASIYFKKQPGATNYVRFRLRFDGSHACSAVVNISTGVISANENTGSTYISSSIKSVGNYWYVTLTGVNASITSTGIRINPAFNTDGTNTSSNAAVGYVEAWGAQLELGSFATSYIPTTTVAVTRAADSIILAGAAATPMLKNPVWVFAQTFNVANIANNPQIFREAGNAFRFVVLSTGLIRISGSANVDATLGSGSFAGVVKSVGYSDATSSFIVGNGGTAATGAANNLTPSGSVFLGSQDGSQAEITGYVQRFAIGNGVITSAQGKVMSTP